MNETLFVESIQAAPSDVACRLVYADWLEERGDPRADLIRIEEEMRTLPVFSDRFWQLKPRRHELLQRSPKDWLATMRDGAECPPTFAHVPTGWKEWWRLIRVFTERWYRYPYLPDVGGRSSEVLATEERLGRKLPPSVREWVAFAYDVRGLWVEHDVLISDDHYVFGELVYRMEELPGYSALVLCQGERDRWRDTVLHANLDVPDPPVHGFTVDPDRRGSFVPLSQPLHGTLTYSVITLAMGRVPGGGGGFTAVLEEPDSILGELRGAFPVQCAFDRTVVFERENLLVVADLHEPSRCHLSVRLFKPLPRQTIPDFLWKYARRENSYGQVAEHISAVVSHRI